MYIHLEQDDQVDPRILRTRELLINSFAKLLIEQKSIRKVSVQDVAKLAGLNRVTFYAHFKDKYELLDVWARLMFRQQVVEKLPDDPSLDTANLTLLIAAMLAYFNYRSKHRRRINEPFEPIFEAATQQELQTVLANMLERTQASTQITSSDTMSTFLSWAVFGSIIEQSRSPKDQPSEVFVADVVTLCESLLAHRA